jgi:hypothetical protein
MMNKQGLAGKREYITLIISKKLEIITRSESGRAVFLLCTRDDQLSRCKETEGLIGIIYGIR